MRYGLSRRPSFTFLPATTAGAGNTCPRNLWSGRYSTRPFASIPPAKWEECAMVARACEDWVLFPYPRHCVCSRIGHGTGMNNLIDFSFHLSRFTRAMKESNRITTVGLRILHFLSWDLAKRTDVYSESRGRAGVISPSQQINDI